MQSCGLWDFCTVQKRFPGQAPCSWLCVVMKEALNGKVSKSFWAPGLTSQGFLCSLQPGGLARHGASGICQGSRREAGASGTRNDQTDCPPASRSSCRATTAQICDSQGLTQHQQQVPVWFCGQRPAKGDEDIKKGSEKEAGGARMKGERKQIGKAFCLTVLS